MRVECIPKLCLCPPAVRLALAGLLELHRRGWTEECSTGLGYDSPAVVAWEGDQAIGVMVCSLQEWKACLSIDVGYVRPDRRGLGVYRALWEAAIGLAKAKGCRRIAGTTHRENEAMQAVMERLGRSLVWLGYEYRLPEGDSS